MNEFSFRNDIESPGRFNTKNENSVYYNPCLHGEHIINGQVYYLKRKKPPSPYALFIKDRLPMMKMENPRGDVGKFFIELGKEWFYMDSEKKCEYYMKYSDEVKKFEILKKSIPVGVNPLLRRIYRDRDLNRSTKRRKHSNNYNSNNTYEDFDYEDSPYEHVNEMEVVKNRKDSRSNYTTEVLHTEYNQEENDNHKDSLSDTYSNKMMRSNGISYKFEKRYHSD